MARRNKYIDIDGEVILDEYTKDMVTALSKLGYKALAHAYSLHTFQHRSRNLHDSYGSAVYVDGKLVESSIRYYGGVLSRGQDKKTGLTGRETLHAYLRSHSFGKTKHEIVLVVVAAMHYTKYLEGGDKNAAVFGPGSKYIVISPAKKYISDHFSEYVNPVYLKYKMFVEFIPKARVSMVGYNED